MLLFWCSWSTYRFIKLDLVTVGKFCFHFSHVLVCKAHCINVNSRAHKLKVGTVLKKMFVRYNTATQKNYLLEKHILIFPKNYLLLYLVRHTYTYQFNLSVKTSKCLAQTLKNINRLSVSNKFVLSFVFQDAQKQFFCDG